MSKLNIDNLKKGIAGAIEVRVISRMSQCQKPVY